MNWKYYESFLQQFRDSKQKRDLTSLVSDAKVFNHLIKDLSKGVKKFEYDKIVCIDSTGFLLGSAVAIACKKGLIPIRKINPKKATSQNHISITYTDYSKHKKGLYIDKRLLTKGERIVIVDDVIESGGTTKAATKLIEKCGCSVVGISCICFFNNQNTDNLKKITSFITSF